MLPRYQTWKNGSLTPITERWKPVSGCTAFVSRERVSRWIGSDLCVHSDTSPYVCVNYGYELNAFWFVGLISCLKVTQCCCVCVCVCVRAWAFNWDTIKTNCSVVLFWVFSCFVLMDASLINLTPPKGRLGISDVSPLSGISRLSVWSHFSISSLLFFLVLLLFLSYPFLLWTHSPDFFFPKPPFSEK